MTDPKQQLLDALEIAGAIAGNRQFLAPDQFVERIDVSPVAIDNLLQQLRFDEPW